MSGTRSPPPVPPVLIRKSPDPSTPVLLTGLASAWILSADGEVRAPRETRGGPAEWGGAYAQGVRLTGPWTIRGRANGREYELPSTLVDLRADRWKVGSSHRWGDVTVRQEILPMAAVPALGRSFEFTCPRPLHLELRQRIEPFLAPVLVEGIRPYQYRLTRRDAGLDLRAFGCGMALTASIDPSAWTIDDRPWNGGELQGEFEGIGVVHEIDVGPEPTVLSLVAWGGLAATIDRAPHLGLSALALRDRWTSNAEQIWSDWRNAAPTMDLPDAPGLARAFDLACGALRALYTGPAPGITGLAAGYPWYPATWGRDLAWMLPAVIWLGDLPWAEASLRTAFHFQATDRIPLLGAEIGELPMQVSPGPVFLYGTSDTTLHYPELVRRFVDHGGALAVAEDLWPHLQAVSAWARAKTNAATGLITNGGEVESMREATAQIGTIHYGFDAVDTTIWDSTDRRDHAIDVQVLYVRALRALAELGRRLGHTDPTGEDDREGARVAEAIRERFGVRETGYPYDSLRRDGTPVPKVRPNALMAVAAGLLPTDAARTVVSRAGREDLTTPWGLRTLSSGDDAYDPTAYHDGQVWTIATAWAAEAAFAVGEPDLGCRYLGIIADRIVEENGLANECYRGDRPEPFDSCFLLGFSVAPFLTVLFERLWGLAVRSDRREITVNPGFPTTWQSARLGHLAVAGGFLDLAWTNGRLTAKWSGPGRVTVRSGAGSLELESAGTGSVNPGPP